MAQHALMDNANAVSVNGLKVKAPFLFF